MLNEDKLKLMISISMFEKHEGKYLLPVNRYFRGDYISRNLWKSFLGYTFCWILGGSLFLVYKAEELFAMMSLEPLMLYGKRALIGYLAGLACYLLITCVVYAKRYEYGVRGQKVYLAKLKRLEKRYEFQNRTKELGRR